MFEGGAAMTYEMEGAAMTYETEERCQALWLSLPSVSDDGLARLGIDRRMANLAGGLAWGRITTAGRCFDFDRGGIPAIVQAVWRGPAPSIECGVEITPSWPT